MDGLQVKYSELLSLAVRLPFYDNGVCAKYASTPVPDLAFVPSAETALLLKKLGLVIRAADRSGGFMVAARTNGTVGPNELLRFPPRKEEKLSFFVLLKNAAFLNFNEMPVSADRDMIFYFSNEVGDLAAPRTDLHLSMSASGVSIASDRIKKSGEVYRYAHGAPVVNAKLKHLLSGAELEPVSVINEGAVGNVLFELSTFPSGKCQLFVNGSVVADDTFYYTGLNAPGQFLAMVELHLFPIAAGEYGISELNKTIKPVKPLFTLLFNNRPTTWRYTVDLTPNSALYKAIDSGSVLVNTIKIESNDNAIVSFGAPVSAGAPVTRLEFLSAATVALREKYVTTAASPLTLTLKAGGTVYKSDLPFPDTGQLDASGFPTIYSDVLITL